LLIIGERSAATTILTHFEHFGVASILPRFVRSRHAGLVGKPAELAEPVLTIASPARPD
jgi:hypothetical protein